MTAYPAWTVKAYDLLGGFLADMSGSVYSDSLNYPKTGLDSYSFSVHLEDPVNAFLLPLRCVVKVWRNVPGEDPRPDDEPNFAGILGPRQRNADSRAASFTAFGALWRLQHRYHIDPHDFTWETGVGIIGYSAGIPTTYGLDPSEIMWRMISFTQALVDSSVDPVFGPIGTTMGIGEGTFANYDFADPPVLIAKRYEVGQNTWDLITDIVEMIGMPELAPSYQHIDDDPIYTLFNTTKKRGSDRAQTFDYNTGARNLDDVQENTTVEPGTFANYIVVQGQDGNSLDGGTQTIERADGNQRAIPGLDPPSLWTPPNYIDDYGLYMSFEKFNNQSSEVERDSKAQALLRRYMLPPVSLDVTLSQALVWNWPNDFDIGDVVTFNCDRDTMVFTGVEKRIEQVTVTRGDEDSDGSESIVLSLAEDWQNLPGLELDA